MDKPTAEDRSLPGQFKEAHDKAQKNMARYHASLRRFRNSEVRNKKIEKALDIIEEYGWIDGAHHKAWVLDQVVRALTGDDYEAWVEEATDGEPSMHDIGTAP